MSLAYGPAIDQVIDDALKLKLFLDSYNYKHV